VGDEDKGVAPPAPGEGLEIAVVCHPPLSGGKDGIAPAASSVAFQDEEPPLPLLPGYHEIDRSGKVVGARHLAVTRALQPVGRSVLKGGGKPGILAVADGFQGDLGALQIYARPMDELLNLIGLD